MRRRVRAGVISHALQAMLLGQGAYVYSSAGKPMFAFVLGAAAAVNVVQVVQLRRARRADLRLQGRVMQVGAVVAAVVAADLHAGGAVGLPWVWGFAALMSLFAGLLFMKRAAKDEAAQRARVHGA